LFGNGRKRFFFEKRSKKLLIPAGLIADSAKSCRKQKFFARFFSKKRCFLCSLVCPFSRLFRLHFRGRSVLVRLWTLLNMSAWTASRRSFGGIGRCMRG
jgi:hypothetical protein